MQLFFKISKLKQIYFNFLNKLVVKNFLYLTIGNALSQFFLLFATLKITYFLSPEKYGFFSFLTLQSQLLISLADLGTRNVIIRKIARDKTESNKIFKHGLLLRIFSVLVIGIVYSIYNHFNELFSWYELCFIIVLTFFTSVFNLIESIFWGYEKMLLPSLINVFFNGIWFFSLFIINSTYATIDNLFILFVIFNLIKAIVGIFTISKFIKLKRSINNFWGYSKLTLKESWPYLCLSVFMIPISFLPSNFLMFNSNQQEIGFFNLSQKLTTPITLILGFALSSIFPNLSILYLKDQLKFKENIQKGIKIFLMMCFFSCFLFSFLIKLIIPFFFSIEYHAAIKTCQLQIWFVGLMAINSFIGTIWGAANKEKLMFKIGLVNALISTPFLFFGSKYGAVGLSMGYVFSFAIVEPYLWYKFKKSFEIKIKNDFILWLLAIILFIISYNYF